MFKKDTEPKHVSLIADQRLVQNTAAAAAERAVTHPLCSKVRILFVSVQPEGSTRAVSLVVMIGVLSLDPTLRYFSTTLADSPFPGLTVDLPF